MLTLLSPAKINLFLQVGEKQSDGYHRIASLMQAISLCDRIYLQLSPADHFTCDNPDLPCDADNLVLRARNLFREKTGISFPLSIHLEKNIPMQAGLGGGSSNAATILWGMNRLAETAIDDKTLMDWGASLGSDVPFFFSTGTAYCRGRGEIVESLSPIPLPPITVIHPPLSLSTSAVYAGYRPTDMEEDPRHLVRSFLDGDFSLRNDLETSAFHLAPQLKTLKEEILASGYRHVLLSGSGSSFFCLGEGERKIPGTTPFGPLQPLSRIANNSWFA